VNEILPDEIHYLKCHDQMRAFLEAHFDMSDKHMETLIGFLRQGNGSLSKRAREREFQALTDEEATQLEDRYNEIFMA
jgi:hypothetical protein